MKTNFAIERCEPRLALDASQVPEGQQSEVIFLPVVPETNQDLTVTSALSFTSAGGYRTV